MTWAKVWGFLKSLPSLLWAALGAAVGLAVLLASARRKGAQIGAAKAKARVETEHVEVLVERAKEASRRVDERRKEDLASGGDGSSEATEVAEAEARAANDALKDDLMRRVRR